MNITGMLYRKFDTVNVSEKLKKRDFVIRIIEKYNDREFTNFVKFEIYNEKIEILDKIEVFDDVDVFFNIKGREWTNKVGEVNYFNSLVAWDIKILNSYIKF